MLYALSSVTTVFINVHSFRINKVPVKIVKMVPNKPTNAYNRSVINSPITSSRTGTTIYYANDDVAWAYLPASVYDDEIEFLERHGMVWYRDFVACGLWGDTWDLDKEANWLRIVKATKKYASVVVIKKHLYNGIKLKVIKQ
jgi:hypothetical protein